ncbi:PREDICTED: probable membrane-associated kinase regulator 1 [Camelina sativa]|uniref:Probable membrane-associated kinase regulator 1 n=1 Tax=Camelina sativa TaxID=90675 RepID=A0ABM0XCQ8_CAMSA|nr:PREDICTED: probable membrane-associated kinase regulator 1 [Camelina sativa]
MQTSRLLSFSSNSPSFGSFSSTVDLAAIAARVVEEFRDQEDTPRPSDSPEDNEDDDNSEFAFDCPSHVCSQPLATADEIFFNGQIRPLNPYGSNAPAKSQPTPRHRRPALRKLMSEELRDPTAASNSSSEAEEDLNGVPPETYCVWTPKQPSSGDDGDDLKGLSSSPSQSKIKSNSAGFSKRWKLRNLLYVRSSSEGNEKLVFPAPVKKIDEKEEEEEEEVSSKVVAGEGGREREETKRQTNLPYRKDMIGILRNVNGLSRHLRPF